MPGFPRAGVLLAARRRTLVNTAWRAGRERRAWTVIAAILVIGWVTASHGVAVGVLGLGRVSARSLDADVAGVLVMLCGFTGMTSVTFTLSSLYFSRDLDLLHSSPLPARSILLTRMVAQLSLGVVLGLIIAGPTVVAFLQIQTALMAAPVILVTVTALVAIVLAGATTFTVFALWLIPARYIRSAGGLVVTVTAFLYAGINVFLRGTDVVSGAATTGATLHVERFGGQLGTAEWSPIGWATMSISDALRGDGLAALVPTLVIALLGAVLVPVAARAAEQAYLVGYQRNASATPGRRQQGRLRRGPIRRRRLPRFALIVGKDLRQIRRDASQLGQLVLPLMIFVFYIGRPTAAGPPAPGAVPRWFFPSLMAAFSGLFSSSGIALRGVGSEGPNMWLLRASPLPVRQLVLAKYVVGWVLASIMGLLLLWIGELRAGASAAELVLATGQLLIIAAGLAGIATGLGAIRPRLDWTDPRRAVGLGVTLSFLAVGSTYITIAFIVLLTPYALQAGAAGAAVGVGVLAAIAAGATATALAAGGRRLAQVEV